MSKVTRSTDKSTYFRSRLDDTSRSLGAVLSGLGKMLMLYI